MKYVFIVDVLITRKIRTASLHLNLTSRSDLTNACILKRDTRKPVERILIQLRYFKQKMNKVFIVFRFNLTQVSGATPENHYHNITVATLSTESQP